MPSQITNHQDQAVARLLEQYKGRPNFEALIRALVSPVQDAEDALWQLFGERSVFTAIGFNLDRIGDMVGIARNGLDDEKYRKRILAKIIVNVSEGAPEALIEAYGLLTDANLVLLQELFPASILLSGDGPEIMDMDEVNFIWSLLEAAALAGVRIDHLVFFDDENPFAFDGPVTPVGDGFSDDAGVVGGKFAGDYIFGFPFAFDGPDPQGHGFGGPADSLVGGIFQ